MVNLTCRTVACIHATMLTTLCRRRFLKFTESVAIVVSYVYSFPEIKVLGDLSVGQDVYVRVAVT